LMKRFPSLLAPSRQKLESPPLPNRMNVGLPQKLLTFLESTAKREFRNWRKSLFLLSFSNSLSQELLSRTASQSVSCPCVRPLSSMAGQELMDESPIRSTACRWGLKN
jgi:hypothetical protein